MLSRNRDPLPYTPISLSEQPRRAMHKYYPAHLPALLNSKDVDSSQRLRTDQSLRTTLSRKRTYCAYSLSFMHVTPANDESWFTLPICKYYLGRKQSNSQTYLSCVPLPVRLLSLRHRPKPARSLQPTVDYPLKETPRCRIWVPYSKGFLNRVQSRLSKPYFFRLKIFYNLLFIDVNVVFKLNYRRILK